MVQLVEVDDALHLKNLLMQKDVLMQKALCSQPLLLPQHLPIWRPSVLWMLAAEKEVGEDLLQKTYWKAQEDMLVS